MKMKKIETIKTNTGELYSVNTYIVNDRNEKGLHVERKSYNDNELSFIRKFDEHGRETYYKDEYEEFKSKYDDIHGQITRKIFKGGSITHYEYHVNGDKKCMYCKNVEGEVIHCYDYMTSVDDNGHIYINEFLENKPNSFTIKDTEGNELYYTNIEGNYEKINYKDGKVISVTLPNITSNVFYNDNGDIIRYVEFKNDKPNDILYHEDYIYDNVGILTEYKDHEGVHNVYSYEYINIEDVSSI